MADNSSDYPTSIDPTAVELVDEVDWITADALAATANSVIAIQNTIGNDPADFTAGGGPDYGTLGAFLHAFARIETGTATPTDTKGGFRVDFTVGRFTAPPVVILQEVQDSEPGQYQKWEAKRVTIEKFTLGSRHDTRSGAAGASVQWIAIQPPFGFERSVDEDEN